MLSGDGSGGVVTVVGRDGDTEVTIWRMDGLVRPDLLVVDALARLQLAAARMGWTIRLHNPSEELRGLLDLVGLADVFADVVVEPPAYRSSRAGSPKAAKSSG